MRGKFGICAMVLTMVLALSGYTAAQEKAADNMGIVKEKIRADKKLFIAENMKLTESEARVFWPVYAAFQADLDKLSERSIKLVESFAKNYDSMSDQTAKKLVEDYLAIEADNLQLRQFYLPKFRAALPDKKVARYYQLENKVAAVIHFELAALIPLFN